MSYNILISRGGITFTPIKGQWTGLERKRINTTLLSDKIKSYIPSPQPDPGRIHISENIDCILGDIIYVKIQEGDLTHEFKGIIEKRNVIKLSGLN